MVSGVVVSGRVVDPMGIGLDNATMIIGEKMALCSQDGSFSLCDIPVGKNRYKIVHRDYPVARGNITIRGDSAFLFMMVSPRDASSAAPGTSILEIKRQIEPWLLEEHGTVVGVGVSSGQDAILVYVRAAEGEFPILPDVPEMIGGFPVYLIPVNAPHACHQHLHRRFLGRDTDRLCGLVPRDTIPGRNSWSNCVFAGDRRAVVVVK